jgi:hypothetical protein
MASRRRGGAVPKDPRPVEERRDGPTFADTKAKQDDFEELLREEEREGPDDEAFEDAAERQRKGAKPADPDRSGSMP